MAIRSRFIRNISGGIIHISDITADHQWVNRAKPRWSKWVLYWVSLQPFNPTFPCPYIPTTQHVHVIETAGSIVGQKLFLLMNQILDGFPGVEDVSCGAPHAGTAFLHPFVCLISPQEHALKGISLPQFSNASPISAGTDICRQRWGCGSSSRI